MAAFNLTSGDLLPILTGALTQNGVPVNLTTATVQLSYQNLRTGIVDTVDALVVSAAGGLVKYEWVAALPHGDYLGEWIADFAGNKLHLGSFNFTVAVGADTPQPIATFRKSVRVLLGDTDPLVKQYSAEDIDESVRLVVNLGKVPKVALTADGLGLFPAVSPLDPLQAENWARIVYHAAKRFVMPNAASSSYRTRALSESFGEQREFVFDLLNDIYQLDNGDGVA